MDPVMREVITEYNPQSFLFCVTEFIRVTERVLPPSLFFKYAPELRNECKTPSGTPLVVQLLGGNAEMLAENAALACDLGAKAIDLNFGCPAPTVNRHDGGATLLQYPERISKIVSLVREKVPASIPVSAKIRLGFSDPTACIENARRIQEAGASWLTVHCRTKTDAYKPPAFWEWIPKLREFNSLPIFVNGELWNSSDIYQSHKMTGERRFMIGRGILSDPFLGLKMKNLDFTFSDQDLLNHENSWDYLGVFNILQDFAQRSSRYYGDNSSQGNPSTSRRLKQWLRFLSLKHDFYQNLFQNIKTLERSDLILAKVGEASEEAHLHVSRNQALQKEPMPLLRSSHPTSRIEERSL